MKKYILVFVITWMVFSCNTKKAIQEPVQVKTSPITVYKNTITPKDLKTHLVALTSDIFQGRKTGEKGQKLAGDYIKKHYQTLGIQGGVSKEEYYQRIPKDYFKGASRYASENVLAFIAGSEKPEEVLVISAHYDHLGKIDQKIYYGADDNGSGTAAVLEIAEAFKMAVTNGEGPKRSILFLNLTGEEEGLYGSRYYAENPIYPFEKTIANLNIDMVGRIDKAHAKNSDYVYIIGSDILSNELHQISEASNKKHTQLELDYTYKDINDVNRFYFRSDHYNFAKNGVPVIFYFNGVHEDYHKATDTEDKIDYAILTKRTQLVFVTAWELANREAFVKRD